jgi:hypothetical protein
VPANHHHCGANRPEGEQPQQNFGTVFIYELV